MHSGIMGCLYAKTALRRLFVLVIAQTSLLNPSYVFYVLGLS